MTQEHPITPPPELVEQWRTAPEYASALEKLTMVTMTDRRLQEIATQAARWGADQELKACCSWADATGWYGAGDMLRTARRSKPPSLKEQSIALLDIVETSDDACNSWDLNTIRRALEQLDD